MSEQIKRYFIICADPDNLGGSMKGGDEGPYVTFTDHSARVAELTEAKDRAERGGG